MYVKTKHGLPFKLREFETFFWVYLSSFFYVDWNYGSLNLRLNFKASCECDVNYWVQITTLQTPVAHEKFSMSFSHLSQTKP